MDKVAIYREHIYKQAATKVQKMINAGKLSAESLGKVFEESPIAKNVNNKINAKALREAGGVLPKGQMTAKKYMNISKTDSLPSRAAVDTKRIMKQQGHENSKVVSELRRQAPEGVNIRREGNKMLDGVSNVSWYNNSGKPAEWNVTIPDSKAFRAFGDNISKRSTKELRSLTARHEISGETVAQSRQLKALRDSNYPATQNNFYAFRTNGHANPEVLDGDAKYVRKLSPETQGQFHKKTQRNIVSVSNPSVNGGQKMNEGQLMNTLRKDHARVHPDEGADITNTPYFKKKLSKDELHESMVNAARLNGHDNREQMSNFATKYMNTPFYHSQK